MRKLLVVLASAVLVAGACGDTAEDEAITTTAETPSGAADVVAGSPLVLAAVDFDAGVVVILNTGPEEYDLSGHFLCNRPSYVEIPAGVLASGESVTVGLDALNATSEDGEVGLYTSRSFGDSNAIVRYVQWGGASHGRTDTAVAAGVWSAGDTIANGGASLVAVGTNPVSAADWSTN